jgi:AraC-like DNA-binding protein
MSNDFAAAAMMRLMAQGLRAQGLALPAPAGAPGRAGAAKGPHVPLAHKRAMLDAMAQAHGPLCLLRIGAAVHTLGDEPTLATLCLAQTPPDMLARWQRLERFIHSRHRVQVLHTAPNALVFRHVSTLGEPPSLAEDLLIAGVLVALAEATGGHALKARRWQHPPWLYREGAWAHAPGMALQGDASTWELHWAPPAAGHATAKAPLAADADLLHQAQAVLRQDPSAPWRLGRLAAQLGLSARSLQRALGNRGTRFTTVLADVRLAHAARLLLETRQSPAQVGYLCGYADQAHFTREFKRRTALAPAQFQQKLSGETPQGLV